MGCAWTVGGRYQSSVKRLLVWIAKPSFATSAASEADSCVRTARVAEGHNGGNEERPDNGGGNQHGKQVDLDDAKKPR